jgi:hypothetical protein
MKSEWATLLEESLQRKGELIPEGWLSTKQIAGDLGKSHSHTVKLVGEWLSSGKLEKRMFMVAFDSGAKPVPFYRIKAETSLPKAA